MRDRSVRVPLTALRADLRIESVRKLFPVDRRTVAGWDHLVMDPFGEGGESWEWIAFVFTGQSSSAGALSLANPDLGEDAPRRAAMVLIPESRLLPVFRSVPPVPTPTPTPVVVHPSRQPTPSPTPGRAHPAGVESGVLSFGRDQKGEFAQYRLRKGEALYSAVVVRFTGELHGEQVNTLALDIAARSGIQDVTSIPVGYRIKIPLELVLPEYLPIDHPRRLEWAQEEKDLARFVEVVRAADLSGVHVILDAGHGGKDTGAIQASMWEAPYAYDVMCRIKVNLERHTRAKVWTIISDSSRGYSIPNQDRLLQDRDQVLLTHPQYRLEDSSTGVHLRWYLANDIIKRQLGPKVPRSKIVFLSVHADSLHPSVRGSMVYVPSRHLRPSSYTVRRRSMSKYEEYRRSPEVKFDSTFAARAEASSRRLAESVLEAIERNEMAVHPYSPIRDRVKRGRHQFVPAVLRYSLAQHAILLECSNLANSEDRALLGSVEWREEYARAVVEGMAAAFENGRSR
ncbi:MAG: hypothetical protein GY906_18365 [bacterium]|nr:hypothetical protein [bacterium]